MSNTYGDYEPEDAWDADDPTPTLIDNLRRRLELLEAAATTTLDDIDRRLAPIRARRDTLAARAQLRLDQLVIDVAYLRNRGDS